MEEMEAVMSAATPEQWRAAYEAKIEDLARETRRTSALLVALRYICSPTTGLPRSMSDEEIVEWIRNEADEWNVRRALATCVTMARLAVATASVDLP